MKTLIESAEKYLMEDEDNSIGELYRKKPVSVMCLEWNGKNVDEVLEFCDGSAKYEDGDMMIETLEDDKEKNTRHFASVGDWIIRGVHGEFYPCKPDIFSETYEKVEDEEDEEE